MKEVVVGIDLGGTNTVFGMIDQEGDIHARGRISTEAFFNQPVDNFLKALSEAINNCMEASNEDFDIKGIGFGAPNGNYYKGTVEHPPNLSWEGVTELAKLFQAYYEVPIVVTNDANAAAMGEMLYGGAKGMKDFIMITLGTGVGSGIVVNGEMVYGHDGFAGEIGHTNSVPDGRQCSCGKKGCFETYASARGIKQTALELIQAQHQQGSLLRGFAFEKMSVKDIYEAALKGDPIAQETFHLTGRSIGKKLADSVAYTSPEAIFLFGGITKAGKYLFDPVEEYLNKYLLEIYRGKIKLLKSFLEESDAAILGAGALIWKELNA